MPKPQLVGGPVQSLVDELMAEYRPGRSGVVCAVGRSEHRGLVEALRARGAQYGWIAQTINEKYGAAFKTAVISRHCRKDCACA